MCTIGTLFNGDTMIMFKQCDLDKEALFEHPRLNINDDIKYVTFERSGNTGTWCGVNNYGVSFVAADSYLDNDDNGIYHNSKKEISDNSIFEAYKDIISKFKNAKSAVSYMRGFYSKFKDPDILIIGDKIERYYIEAYNSQVIVVKLDSSGIANFFTATNHFRYIHGGVDYSKNHSTYLRLQRSQEILNKECNLRGVIKLLKDQYYGKSVLSICRSDDIVPEFEDSYKTMATSIFIIDNDCGRIGCYYQINGNPRKNKLSFIPDVFNSEHYCR
ncbi:MAG: hypothetical protein Q4F66_02745 [Clostridium sp.]|nr:hypothetical protein [Clostridium sp.]